MYRNPWEEFKYLKMEMSYRKGDGYIHRNYLKFDDQPLISEENAEVWSDYLSSLLKKSITVEAMESEEFKQIAEKCRERREKEKRWAELEKRRRERELYRRKLRRIVPLGYIPDGLNVDYEKEYSDYAKSAIEWTPKDTEDFVYQCRSLERFAGKSMPKMLEVNRPDAAYAMSLTLCQHLPLWLARNELEDYFYDHKPRLKKLILSAYESLAVSAVAWNNEEKRLEVCRIIEEDANRYEFWGLKSKTLLALAPLDPILGSPITIERKPNKAELYEIERAQRKAKEEARRKAEEEAEKRSLIPLNQFLEQTVFASSHIDWECMTIGRMISTVGSEVKKYIDRGQTHDALLLFLQIVKSMCRHYIKDEHYNYFDDMYAPDYSCRYIVDTLNDTYAKGKFSQSDLDFFHQAWKEIEQTEAYNEGIADYKFKF